MFNRSRALISAAVAVMTLGDRVNSQMSIEEQLLLRDTQSPSFNPRTGKFKTGHQDHRRSQPKRRKLARQMHGHQRFRAKLKGR